MIYPINFDITCKQCGGILNIAQKQLGQIRVGICRKCVKAKVMKIIQAKQDDFNLTYDQVKEGLLAEDPPTE